MVESLVIIIIRIQLQNEDKLDNFTQDVAVLQRYQTSKHCHVLGLLKYKLYYLEGKWP